MRSKKQKIITVMTLATLAISTQMAFAAEIDQPDQGAVKTTTFIERVMNIVKGTDKEAIFRQTLIEKNGSHGHSSSYGVSTGRNNSNGTNNRNIIMGNSYSVSQSSSKVETPNSTSTMQEKKGGVLNFFERMFISARNGIGSVLGYRTTQPAAPAPVEPKPVEDQMKELNSIPDLGGEVAQPKADTSAGTNKESVKKFNNQPMNVDDAIVTREVVLEPNTAMLDKKYDDEMPSKKMVLQWYNSSL